jgi:hypothetical protein
MSLSHEHRKAIEEWSKTPTPVYDEFKVDWKKLHASTDTPEAHRIDKMFASQLEKLQKTYPKFNVRNAKWPVGDSMMQLPSAVGQRLMAFQAAERAAATGFESPQVMAGIAEQKLRDLEAQRIQQERAVKRREIAMAREEGMRYSKVKTGDLLDLDKKEEPEKDLMKFPSRDEELKGLFGGRGKKSRKGKSKKARKTRRRRA